MEQAVLQANINSHTKHRMVKEGKRKRSEEPLIEIEQYINQYNELKKESTVHTLKSRLTKLIIIIKIFENSFEINLQS